MSAVGSKHAAFSDFPVLPMIKTTSAQSLIDIMSKLSVAFIEDKLEEGLASSSTRKMEVEIIGKKKDGRPKRRLVGVIGDVIVA